MRFTGDSAKLRKAARFFSTVEKMTYPISLSATKVGDAGSVTIDTLEGNKFVSLSFEANVIEEGEVLFPSKYLPYFIIDRGDIAVNSRKDNFIIKTTYEYTVPLYLGEVPRAVKKPICGSATFELSEIKTLFKRILFATGDDSDSRYNRRCILLQCEDSCLKAVGGDYNIVAVSSLEKGSPYKGRFIFPKGGIYTINKLEGSIVTLTFYENAIGFSTVGEISCDIYMPGVATVFPKYEDILSVEGKTFLMGDAEQLLDHISAVRKVSDKLTLNMGYSGYVKQPPRVYATEGDGSKFSANLPLEWQGEDLKISVNSKLLYEAIEQITGKVSITFTHNSGRFAIKGEGDDYLVVMLPY